MDSGEGPSYSSFDPVGAASSAAERDDPGSPTLSVAFDSDDEADGGGASKSRHRHWKRPAMVSFLVYVMKQSYILTLIAMMVSGYYGNMTDVKVTMVTFEWVILVIL